MADVTNATWARKTKAKKRHNETDDVVFAGRHFSKSTLNFQNYVVCADFFQSTLNRHNYFLRTIVAAWQQQSFHGSEVMASKSTSWFFQNDAGPNCDVMSDVQAKIFWFRTRRISSVQYKFFPIKPMFHVLIALKTISYLQANNDGIRAGRIPTS